MMIGAATKGVVGEGKKDYSEGLVMDLAVLLDSIQAVVQTDTKVLYDIQSIE